MKAALLLFVVCIGIAYAQTDPVCLIMRFQQDSTLTQCVTDFTTNPTNFCNLDCAQALADVYTDCQFEPNPVLAVCPNLNDGSDNGQQTPAECLTMRLLQDNTLMQCSTELAMNPTNFCNLDCALALADAYTECQVTPNPILVVCPSLNGDGSTGVDNNGTSNGTEVTNGQPDVNCILESLSQNTSLIECSNILVGVGPSSVCSLPCVQGLEQVYTDCGFTETSSPQNPVTAACNILGGSGTGPITPFPTGLPFNPLQGVLPLCVARELQIELGSISSEALQNCSTLLISGDVQALCDSTCIERVTNAYRRCGYTEAFNPAIMLCDDVAENRTAFGQLTCLARELQLLTFSEIQPCTSAITFIGDTAACQSPCAERLRLAYSTCGFEGDRNPVEQFCSLPVIPPGNLGNITCLSSSLQTANLQSCLLDLTINPTGICATDCIDNLSAAYSGCGFTGVNNPIDLVCGYVQNATNGLDNPLQTCITRIQQGIQRCLSNTIITGNFNFQECASDIKEAFAVCGFDEQIFNLTGIVCAVGGDTNLPVSTDATTTTTEATDQSNSRGQRTQEGEDDETRTGSSGAPVVTGVSMVIMTSIMLVFNTVL